MLICFSPQLFKIIFKIYIYLINNFIIIFSKLLKEYHFITGSVKPEKFNLKYFFIYILSTDSVQCKSQMLYQSLQVDILFKSSSWVSSLVRGEFLTMTFSSSSFSSLNKDFCLATKRSIVSVVNVFLGVSSFSQRFLNDHNRLILRMKLKLKLRIKIIF